MAYAMDSKKFAGKIKSITASTSKMREDVQDALIAATFLCLKNSGGTTPFQQILDAVGTAAHRQGITQWAETFAPVILREGKLILNKSAFKDMDKEGILADFDAHIAESGMDQVKWYDIAKEKNATGSIWNFGGACDNLFKKLENAGMNELSKDLRAAYDAHMLKAIKAELAPAQQ